MAQGSLPLIKKMGGLRSMNKYELAMFIVALLTLIVTALNFFK